MKNIISIVKKKLDEADERNINNIIKNPKGYKIKVFSFIIIGFILMQVFLISTIPMIELYVFMTCFLIVCWCLPIYIVFKMEYKKAMLIKGGGKP